MLCIQGREMDVSIPIYNVLTNLKTVIGNCILVIKLSLVFTYSVRETGVPDPGWSLTRCIIPPVNHNIITTCLVLCRAIILPAKQL